MVNVLACRLISLKSGVEAKTGERQKRGELNLRCGILLTQSEDFNNNLLHRQVGTSLTVLFKKSFIH